MVQLRGDENREGTPNSGQTKGDWEGIRDSWKGHYLSRLLKGVLVNKADGRTALQTRELARASQGNKTHNFLSVSLKLVQHCQSINCKGESDKS
jgi:hypothetical protein